MSDTGVKRKKTSYAYAWTGEGDLYDQAFALNRGRFRRAREQQRVSPDTPVRQRKQSSMTVIASSPEVKEQLLQKHQEKAQEIAESRVEYRQDVRQAQTELSQAVWADTGRRWGTYNPIRLLSWWSSNTTSTAQASDTNAIRDRRDRLRAYESALAGVPEDEAIHSRMRFVEMKDLPSGKEESQSRKLHLLGHGGPGMRGLTALQNPTKVSHIRLFNELSQDFHQQGVLDKFGDLRMESCWSANPVRTDQYMRQHYSHKHTDIQSGDTSFAPAVHLHRELKALHPRQSFQIKAYEGKGSQISNPIGQKQRYLTNYLGGTTVRQSTVARVFSSHKTYD